MAWRTESASKISIGRIGMSPPDKPMAALCESKLAAARFRSFAGGNDSRDRNPQKPCRRQSALGPNPYLLAAMRLRPSGISGNERPLQPNGNACRPERPLTGCIPFFGQTATRQTLQSRNSALRLFSMQHLKSIRASLPLLTNGTLAFSSQEMGRMRRRNSTEGNRPLPQTQTGWPRCVFDNLNFGK